MGKQEKQIHFRLQEALYVRIHRLAAKNDLRMSEFLRHVLEKSLELLEIGDLFSSSPYQGREGQESEGKTYTFRNLAYQIGGEPWLADAFEP